MRLEGKVAIVTGAGRVGRPGRNRGFGPEICRQLAIQGADIVVNDFSGPLPALPDYDLATKDEVAAVVEEVKGLGRRAISVDADVGNAKAVDEMVKKTLEEFGRIDILVNNAGIAVGLGPMHELDEPLFDLSWHVMAKGPWLCSKAVAKVMIEQGWGGKIVTIASILGKTYSAFAGGYTAAKHAVIGITRTMAAELIKYKINVNAICPGWCDTHLLHLKGGAIEMYPKLLGITKKQLMAALNGWTPAGRLGTVEEIAGATMLLCLSPESDYINGQGVAVDGGGITI
jgi:NAD(P)-dependent dehydrogenase (short-subunit alcohol dehydrogenase family)